VAARVSGLLFDAGIVVSLGPRVVLLPY